MKKFRSSFLLFIFSLSSLIGQSRSGDLEAYLQDYVSGIPGNSGNHYAPPVIGEFGIWEDAIERFLIGDIEIAKDIFTAVNYQIIEYIDSKNLPGQLYYILEEKTPKSKHWGTYVFNPSPCREKLVLQAPHSRADINTGFEAIHCFVRLAARALFLSGTHRCNHSDPSGCDGTTSVCGNSAAYRITDMAHNVETAFHSTTRRLAEYEPSTVFFQFHGFTKQASDPFLILSNGSRTVPNPDYTSLLAEKLIAIDSELTAKIGHIDTDWNRLLGFTNTQGRFLNSSPSPCSQEATVGTGRFVHVEQERLRLRADSSGWNKMKGALEQIFPCFPVGWNPDFFAANEINIYPNPTDDKINIKGNKIQKIQIVDLSGRVLFFQEYFDIDELELHLPEACSSLVFLLVQMDGTIVRRKILVTR